MSVTAVLLAAGLGTRLRPLTDHVPKCLVPIQGTPLLGIWLDMLFDHDVESVLINLHYLPHRVLEFIDKHPLRHRIEAFHEDTLLGTAGTLRAMAPRLRGDTSFFVAHADNLVDFDFAAFRLAHVSRPKQVHLSMLTFTTDSPSSCGIVQCDGRSVVTAFHEKVADPPGRLANGAVYWMDATVLRFIADGDMTDLSTQVLPRLLGRMQAWHDPRTYLRDIGTPEALALAQSEWPARTALGALA